MYKSLLAYMAAGSAWQRAGRELLFRNIRHGRCESEIMRRRSTMEAAFHNAQYRDLKGEQWKGVYRVFGLA